MAVLIECLVCHTKQATKHKKCKGCEDDLDAQKRLRVTVTDEVTDKKTKRGKVRYHIQYRTPDGKQHRQFVGYSLQEAQDADGKRKGQKREGRIFDMVPGKDMTFGQLTAWFMEQEAARSKKAVAYKSALARFNETFGDTYVIDLKVSELETWQTRMLKKEGLAESTVHGYRNHVQEMVRKADDDDLIDPRALKPFRKAKKIFETGGNARTETLSLEDYQKLLPELAPHLKPYVTLLMHTGMRPAEPLKLEWSMVDREAGMLRLPGRITKGEKDRSIPINHHVERVLQAQRFGNTTPYVLTYGGRQLKKNVRRGFAAACKRVGIAYGQDTEGGLVLHDIRATVKTNMLEAGVDKELRDVILGHSLEGMDKHYLRFKDEHLKAAMDRYTTWLDNSVAHLVTQTASSEA